jgi:hypothetical protein
LPENDYSVSPEPRIQHWNEGLASRINRRPPETTTDYRRFVQGLGGPVVSHEIGQWCAFPNFAELPKYTGYLQPKNLEIFRDFLAARGMLEQADDFLLASGKLQVLCYKEEIESALRTPEMGGFQLLGLSDFPGQGTALVGVLDAFWEEKGYVSAAEFRRFCASTVPLARLERRVFTTGEHLQATVEIAQFGPRPLHHAKVQWQLAGPGPSIAAQGEFADCEIGLGTGASVGKIDVPLRPLRAPAKYQLRVAVAGTEFANDWDVWVYPDAPATPPSPPAGVRVAREFDAAVRADLEAGGTVFLALDPARVRVDAPEGRIDLGFSSIFWNTAWTKRQAPQTLGILCDPRSPALAAFPTERWSNWQWWYPIRHAAPMILDDFPRGLRPIVQVVPDWNAPHKLALAFEARVGRGRLLVTSIDLLAADLDPVRRQLRDSLLAYAGSDAFAPTVTVSPDQVRNLSVEPSAGNPTP